MIQFMQALRRRALRHPHVSEGVACEGTALERRTVKVGKKAFVFLGRADAMLKLERSLADARKRAAKSSSVSVGSGGWAKIRFGPGAPPLSVLERWVDESYATIAGGKQTPARATSAKKPAAKKPAAKKPAAKKPAAKKPAAKKPATSPKKRATSPKKRKPAAKARPRTRR